MFTLFLELFCLFLAGIFLVGTVSPIALTLAWLCTLYYFLGTPNTLAALSTVPWVWVFVGFILHLMAGGVYSLWAWKDYLKSAKKIHTELRNDDIVKFGLPNWANPAYNKDKLYCWIMGWEFDAIFRLIKDPIKMTYEYMSSSYTEAANKIVLGK